MTIRVNSPCTANYVPTVDNVWGQDWYDANPYGNRYQIKRGGSWSRHTGADLNRPKNVDFHQPLFAMLDGIVLHAELLCGISWGYGVVIEHTHPITKQLFQVRYGHVENIQVRPGSKVNAGDTIAYCSDGNNYYPDSGAHLHFDISTSGILITRPDYWPNDSESLLHQHFVDPKQFILSFLEPVYIPPAPPAPVWVTKYVNTPASTLYVRTSPSKNGSIVERLPHGKDVTIDLNSLTDGYYKTKLRNWVHSNYLSDKEIKLSKYNVGFHVFSGGKHDDFLGVLRETHLRSTPLPGIKLTKQGWEKELTVATIKALSPSTKVMLRWYRHDESALSKGLHNIQPGDGTKYATDYFNQINNDPDFTLADYHQIICEPVPPYNPAGYAMFWSEVQTVADDWHVKLGLFAFPVTHPPMEFWDHPAIHAVIERGIQRGDVLALDQYVLPQAQCVSFGLAGNADTLYRHKMVYARLPEKLRKIKLWLAEVGDIKSLKCSGAATVEKIKDWIFNTADDEQIEAACFWSLQNGGSIEWVGDELDPIVRDIAALHYTAWTL